MRQPLIRTEQSIDRDAVTAVLNAAFGRGEEAELVDQLRRDGDAVLALVAELDGKPVGHILFSRAVLEAPDGDLDAVVLSTLGVVPAHQHQGIGTSLTEAGLRLLEQIGEHYVFVLGDPGYYQCFDFDSAAARPVRSHWSEAAGDAHMLLALRAAKPGTLAGYLRYAKAFDRFTGEMGSRGNSACRATN